MPVMVLQLPTAIGEWLESSGGAGESGAQKVCQVEDKALLLREQ